MRSILSAKGPAIVSCAIVHVDKDTQVTVAGRSRMYDLLGTHLKFTIDSTRAQGMVAGGLR